MLTRKRTSQLVTSLSKSFPLFVASLLSRAQQTDYIWEKFWIDVRHSGMLLQLSIYLINNKTHHTLHILRFLWLLHYRLTLLYDDSKTKYLYFSFRSLSSSPLSPATELIKLIFPNLFFSISLPLVLFTQVCRLCLCSSALVWQYSESRVSCFHCYSLKQMVLFSFFIRQVVAWASSTLRFSSFILFLLDNMGFTPSCGQ